MKRITLGLALLLSILFYLTAPQISLDNPGLIASLFMFFGPMGFGYVILTTDADSPFYQRSPMWGAVPLCLAVILLISGLTGMVISAPMLRSNQYQAMLGTEVQKDFKASLPPLDAHNAPLVSYDMAMRVAEKKLSEVPALGSQAQVGHMQKQRIGHELFWVGFLEHSGFFAWWNQGYTPGYVKVSATNPENVELVTQVKGKPLKMRYLTSAYLGSDAERYLRFSGYASKGLMDFSPEVDDDGNPFLVVTVFERKVGFSGQDAVGVVILDIQTGDQKYYSIKDTPAWVDRIQPREQVEIQVNDRLEYVHGWLNPSHEGKLHLSGEMDVVYGQDGQAYFYGGLTSMGSDNGLVGFVMVNTRTKETTRYSLVGVTGAVAKEAAQGVLPEKKYQATNPLPFMVSDTSPVYVMALKDSTGIARAYAVVDLTDYQRVAVADTLASALRSFTAKAGISRTTLAAGAPAAEKTLTAKVLRIASEVRQGNSSYVLVLAGQPGQLFAADINRSEDMSVTKEGDTVYVETIAADQSVLPVLVFKNLTLHSEAPPQLSTAAKK